MIKMIRTITIIIIKIIIVIIMLIIIILLLLIISSCYRTVPSALWEIFSEFLIFCNLFQEPLGE